MDRLRDEVLSCAAFSLNQDRGRFAGRHLAHKVHQVQHARGLADHLVVSGTLPHLFPQAIALGAQHRPVDSIGDGDLKLVEVQRLLDKIQGAQFDRRLDIVKLGITSDHNDWDGKIVLFDLPQDFNSAEVGQAHVKQDQVGQLRADLRQSSRAAFGLQGRIAPLFELPADGPANQLFVVDNQDFLIGHRFLWIPRPPRAWASG